MFFYVVELLDDWNVDVPSWKYPRNLESPSVSSPGFGNDSKMMAATAKTNRRSTASDLSRQLSSATGTTVSRQTVYIRLGHIGLYARRPVRYVPLTATHCRLRLTWSREHALWTPQQWSCVMFSDESRFSLQSDSRRTLIWRTPGTRYHQENTIERYRYGGAGWLVWRGIILGSRSDLHAQSVTMIGHIYRNVMLEQHVRLFQGTMGAEFLFMDDNARPHRANIVDECLQSVDITRMDWPAYSPDLNLIEHVWDMLGRRIAARQPPPTSLPELRRALLDEWCNIPQDQIDNLILSTPRRYGDRFNSYQVIYSQFGLAIHQNDHQARRRFVEWAQNEIAVVPDFHKRILFSDEAPFWLNGYVNKQKLPHSEWLIHKCMSKHRYIQKTDCLVRFMGWWESLVRTSSKTMKATTLQSMVIGIEP
ncbi:transposable element Tc1 transposase [Trichonephila clavipes]|nr:transposable element Tc1 transposase [Trichonephila clavipes]